MNATVEVKMKPLSLGPFKVILSDLVPQGYFEIVTGTCSHCGLQIKPFSKCPKTADGKHQWNVTVYGSVADEAKFEQFEQAEVEIIKQGESDGKETNSPAPAQ